MTTKHSPLGVLKAQADKIAAMLKGAERGDKIDARFAARIAEARTKSSFKVGIVMDDKTIVLTLPWDVIRNTTDEGLAEYILGQMREAQDGLH